MTAELKHSLLRVLPFLVVIAALFIAIRRKRLNANDLGIQEPNSLYAFLAWWGLFLVFAVAVEAALYYFRYLEVKPWQHS